jgi:hypothetical protein
VDAFGWIGVGVCVSVSCGGCVCVCVCVRVGTWIAPLLPRMQNHRRTTILYTYTNEHAGAAAGEGEEGAVAGFCWKRFAAKVKMKITRWVHSELVARWPDPQPPFMRVHIRATDEQ